MTTPTRSPAKPPRVRRPSPEKTARTRAQIIEAALAEFLEHGYASATMAGIARRAGLAKGTSYKYFPHKEALFLGIVQHIVNQPLNAAMNLPINTGERVADYLRRTLVPAMRELELAGRASVARLILAEGRRFPFLVQTYRKDVYDPFLAHIRQWAHQARQQGELTHDLLERHPHLLAGPLWISMVHNGIIDPAHPIDAADLFAAQLDLLFGPPSTLK